MPKEDKILSQLLFPPKPNFNDITKNSQPIPIFLFPEKNGVNIPPSSNKFDNENKKIINVTKKENNNVNQINNYQIKNMPKINCTCTRTQCLKKYCACFSYGIPCQSCECKGCLNIPKTKNKLNNDNNEINKENINNNIYQENIFVKNLGSNCTKSLCLKNIVNALK